MKGKRLRGVGSILAVFVLLSLVLAMPAGGAATSSGSSCGTIHVVTYGQTAATIAERYGISLSQLVAANQLRNPDRIYTGQRLCIPLIAGLPTPPQTVVAGGNPGICIEGQVIDKAHTGLGPGIEVVASLDGAPGVVTETDEAGLFSFSDLQPGIWTLRVSVPDSWEAVTPSEFPLDLAYGHQGCYTVRFKLNPLGCIVARKTDEQGNPLSGWLISVSGPIDPEQETDESGIARFDGLEPGTYVVTEAEQYPWQAVQPARVVVSVEAAEELDDCTIVDFVNQQQPTSCITGKKVDDQHQGLAGWMIYASRADGAGPTFMTVTADDGSFTFPNLTLGEWVISEDLQDFWTPITPSEFSVTLGNESAPPECVEVRFKNRPPDLCAEGYKVDENGDGLAGWKVIAQSEADPTSQKTAVTDARGYYRFNDLTLGNWVFSEVQQVGWEPLTQDTVKVEIKGGARCTQVPIFRNRSPRGCIEGFKRDNLHVGLPGWTIYLQAVDGSTPLRRVTDGTGHFLFDELPVGTYRVWEGMQRGWTALTPTEVEVEITASDEAQCRLVEFINKQVERDICIDGHKLDANGRIGLPGWTVTAKNLETGVTLSTLTDGLGYFRFGQLDPGEYEVEVEEQPGWGPVGPQKSVVKVAWPPSLECTSLTFLDRQEPPPPVDPPPGCVTYYTVAPCDTLARIAIRFGVSVGALMSANQIVNPDLIQIGQVLCIPDP